MAKFDTPETLALIKKAAVGDHGACTEIYVRYVGKVREVCRGMLQNEAIAEEISQDVFLQVNRKIGTFKRKAALKTWIYSIAVNACKMAIRARKTNSVSLDEEFLDDYVAVHDRRLETAPERLILKELIAGLKPDDQSVVTMRLLGYTNEEIAIHYGMTVQAMKSKYARAVISMREAYAKRVRSVRNSLRNQSEHVRRNHAEASARS